jgi:hypothetical protein
MNTRKLNRLTPFMLTSLAAAISQAVVANDTPATWQQAKPEYGQAVHGGVGLIQTPTARMADEGNVSVNYTDNDDYRFWSVSIQLYPWMEATVRYTDVRNRLYSNSPEFSGDQTLKDKGIDAKFRLWQESRYLPQVAVGFRDFGGTGFFESEFIALSKQAGPFDLHLGMGWGYLGTAGNTVNPFCEIRDSFCTRPGGFSGLGGKIDYQRFFKGPASLYGGIEYQTPWQPLRLKAEYEGNNYSRDRAPDLVQDSRWNFAATYKWQDFDFNLNYQRGNTLGFGVNYAFNMHNIEQIKIKPAPKVVPSTPITSEFEEIDRYGLLYTLRTEAGYLVRNSHINDTEITLYGNQIAFRDHDEAIERIGRILAATLPERFTTYRIVTMSGSRPMVETVINVPEFKAQARYETLQPAISSTYVRQDPVSSTLNNYQPERTSGYYTNLEAFWIQTFGNPEAFYLYQAGAILSVGYAFNHNFSVHSSAKVNVFENFDKFNFKVDSQPSTLPRVRTYIREYVTRSRVTLDNLYGNWQDRLAPNVYGQLYGGYLETMYGGVGGEILYRPVDSNLSFGVDLNYVQQRSYENDWDFFNYKTLTGHLNVYWQPTFLKDTLLTFNIGQFLAKDKGVNIDFAKRFNSGMIVGAYAAFTDASSADYGEGSFTKGFYLSIPFDLFSISPSIGRGRLPWVPISRDGGQMLNRPILLNNTTAIRTPFVD